MSNKLIDSDFEEMRAQFKMLTEKVEKQNVITKQLLEEISRQKIRKYEFWTSWFGYIMLWVTIFITIINFYKEGYPLWGYFSIIYMGFLATILKIFELIGNKKYLKKIGYDVVKYIEDLKNRNSNIYKTIISFILLILPAIINFWYLVNYLINSGEIEFGIEQWWIYILIGITTAISLGIILKKIITKLAYNILA
ncbi:MAG: hypothetical protein IKU18_00325 [Bacteroidales bacterium]|nr:hypothetical protein [Bacteroidales bacterium]